MISGRYRLGWIASLWIAAVAARCHDQNSGSSEMLGLAPAEHGATLTLIDEGNVSAAMQGFFLGQFAVSPNGTTALIDDLSSSLTLLDSAGKVRSTTKLSALNLPNPTLIESFRFLDDHSLVFWIGGQRRAIVVDTATTATEFSLANLLPRGDYQMVGVDRNKAIYLTQPRQGTDTNQTIELISVDLLHDISPPVAISLPINGWPPRVSITVPGRLSISSPIPLYPGPRFSIGYDGSLYWTSGDQYEVHLRRPGHPDTVLIRRTVDPVAVSEDERKQFTDEQTARYRYTDSTWIWNGPPVPDHLPAIGELQVDDRGRVWATVPKPSTPLPEAEQYRRAEIDGYPTVRWKSQQAIELFDRDGTFLGRADIPPNAQVASMAVRGERLWLLLVDRQKRRVELHRFRVVLSPG